MIFKKNTLLFGILLGLILPLLGVWSYYWYKFYPTFKFTEFYNALVSNRTMITAVSSMSLLLNVVIFTFYLNAKKDQTAKGIFLITCLYMLAVLLYKLIR